MCTPRGDPVPHLQEFWHVSSGIGSYELRESSVAFGAIFWTRPEDLGHVVEIGFVELWPDLVEQSQSLCKAYRAAQQVALVVSL